MESEKTPPKSPAFGGWWWISLPMKFGDMYVFLLNIHDNPKKHLKTFSNII